MLEHTRPMEEQVDTNKFSLVVNDFGFGYIGNQRAEHLITYIKTYYPVLVDWTGGLYCEVSLDW